MRISKIRVAVVYLIAILGILLLCPWPCMGDEGSFQPPIKDTYVCSGAPTANYGSATYLQVGWYGLVIYRSLLEFDVDWGVDIPTGATINNASLNIYINDVVGSATYLAQRLLRTDWVESGATWNNYKSGTAWTSAGASGDGTDYTSQYESTTGSPAIGNWMTWDDSNLLNQVLAARVSDINPMFKIMATSETGDSHIILAYSKEYTGDTSLRPKLIISYTWEGTMVTITADPAYATAAPNVTATNATGITGSGATLHGNVTDDAGGHITMRGFEWGTETGNYTASWNETGEFEIGAFDHAISGLDFCTEIFWRAFAVNDYGQGNSTEQSFTTNCLPSAPTDFTVTQIGINSVNITWTPDPMADIVVIRVGEGECPDSVTEGTEVYSGNGTSVVVTGLMFEMTTYCYQAWSQNDYGYSPDYAEASIGNALGLPTIMFVVGLCGFALWKREWLRVLLAIAVVMWGAFAMSYDVKIAAPLVAIGAALFFMGIFRVMKQAREET